MAGLHYKYYRGKRIDTASTWYFRTSERTTDIDVIIRFSDHSKVTYTLVEDEGLIPFINEKLYADLNQISKAIWDMVIPSARTIREVFFNKYD